MFLIYFMLIIRINKNKYFIYFFYFFLLCLFYFGGPRGEDLAEKNTGQHASCDHMERMLRQNRDSHGKRGETQIK